MINKVTLVGNVGKDPEIKYLDQDTVVARFPLATSESYNNPNGERITNTEWHNITIWRGLAKVVEKYVKKGDLLYLEGKIRTRSYDDKDGVKKYFTEVQVNEMKMLGKRGDSDNGATSHDTSTSAAPADSSQTFTNDSGDDTDDLPF
ncbi:MAG: single-stranded DNA-binding protein [Bacteroidales bacterium]|jgi:single-strand DNA-binding protein|nr:single-stranded DNA-binding protein [Bacteroidales bacterium]